MESSSILRRRRRRKRREEESSSWRKKEAEDSCWRRKEAEEEEVATAVADKDFHKKYTLCIGSALLWKVAQQPQVVPKTKYTPSFPWISKNVQCICTIYIMAEEERMIEIEDVLMKEKEKE